MRHSLYDVMTRCHGDRRQVSDSVDLRRHNTKRTNPACQLVKVFQFLQYRQQIKTYHHKCKYFFSLSNQTIFIYRHFGLCQITKTVNSWQSCYVLCGRKLGWIYIMSGLYSTLYRCLGNRRLGDKFFRWPSGPHRLDVWATKNESLRQE